MSGSATAAGHRLVIVDSAHFVRGVRESEPLTVAEAAARPRSGGSFVWLEHEEPDREEMEALRDGFGLHELADSLAAFLTLGLGSLVCSGTALWVWLRRAQK